MSVFRRKATKWLSLAVAYYARIARADCECGYSINSTSSPSYQVFTDLIETDFLTIQNISLDRDWAVQKYFVAPSENHYGRNCTAANVISNPLTDKSSLAGPGILGGTPGLQLWVRGGDPPSMLVPSGEVRTVRGDMLYGSFRTAAKLTPVSGTCSAMFSYYNASQEIDIELLSRQYSNSSLLTPASPLNLAVHSLAELEAGYQMPNTSNYGQPVLPVSLTDSFHEYRFDWTPGLVSFYFDGAWIWDLVSSDVPVEAASMRLSHWSNGAPGWSQGPPHSDAVVAVAYFKAYFNSSDPTRLLDHAGRCTNPSAPRAVCLVPDQHQ